MDQTQFYGLGGLDEYASQAACTLIGQVRLRLGLHFYALKNVM